MALDPSMTVCMATLRYMVSESDKNRSKQRSSENSKKWLSLWTKLLKVLEVVSLRLGVAQPSKHPVLIHCSTNLY